MIMIDKLLLKNLISQQQKKLANANLVSINDIANFVKKDFDKNLETVLSNKNQLNELSKKVKVISTIGLRKDVINKFSILKERTLSIQEAGGGLGGWRVLQIFQKRFPSPADHRSKYFMGQ